MGRRLLMSLNLQYLLFVLTTSIINNVNCNSDKQIEIIRGRQDIFTNPFYHNKGKSSECAEFNATCVGENCTRCQCFANRTFVEIKGTINIVKCVDNDQLMYVTSYNSSFLVKETTTEKCLATHYDKQNKVVYVVVKKCKKHDQSQRWIWTKDNQLLNWERMECATERTQSEKHKFRYVVLKTCKSNMSWRHKEKDSLILYKSSGNYMVLFNQDNGVHNHVITYYKTNYTKTINEWKSLYSNKSSLSSKAIGCQRYGDKSSLLVLEKVCKESSPLCTGKKTIPNPNRQLTKCSILRQQTQYLNQQYMWEKISLNGDIFNISEKNNTSILKWNFNGSTNSEWSNKIIRLQFSCNYWIDRATEEETSCILIKIGESYKRCNNNSSHGKGGCESKGNTFNCTRYKGYERERCERKTTTQKPQSQMDGNDGRIGTIPIIVGVVVVLIIIVAAIVFIICMRRKRSFKHQEPNTDDGNDPSRPLDTCIQSNNPLYSNEGTTPSAGECGLYESTPDHVYQYIDNKQTTPNNQFTYDYAVSARPTKYANAWKNGEKNKYSKVAENEAGEGSTPSEHANLDKPGESENLNDEITYSETTPKYHVLEKE